MLPPKFLDEELRPYATPTQWAYYERYVALGSGRAVAKEQNKAWSTIQEALGKMMHLASLAGYLKAEHCSPAPTPELAVKGLSTLRNRDGEVTAEWELKRDAGMDPEEAFEMPDPKVVDRVSTYKNGQGRVIGQWVSEKRSDADRAHLWEQFRDEILAAVPVRSTITYENEHARSYGDLLAVYPVGDHHTGMVAWAKECGKNWDLKIANETLRKAAVYLIDQCPPCDECLIPFLGDFFHYDSYKPVTPAHGNQLDADGRFPKMVDVGWMMVEHIITAALEKHKHVTVIWETGNHDEATAAMTRSMLKRLYRGNPRVTIDESDAYIHYFQFGKVMLFTNHSDRIKMDKLLAVAAADQSVMWGETTYRMGMVGHGHHEQRKEFPGGWVEMFGVLPPADAYAARGGYRSAQQMHALVFHRDGYLQTRHMFYPDMVEAK
jgi:hypothetical protein